MRLKIAVRGAVQGVGFRPFVHRLATEMALCGWVNNSAQGVLLEVEGPPPDLERFLLRLEAEHPPRSVIQSLEASWLDPVGYAGFEIRPSETGGQKTAVVLPDIATCSDCLRELFDPADRRYGYPFINCTNCGPRFSIIEALPYDRPHTTMRVFAMCPQCQAEYDDPANRRFHAQPNACPECGPHLELWSPGCPLESADHGPGASGLPPQVSPAQRNQSALDSALAVLRAGRILAIKGLGGFQLLVAAEDNLAVRRLRELKHREEKPFAVMFPSLERVRQFCEVSPLEERLLRSPEAPIVLLGRRLHSVRGSLSPSLAPGNPNLGVMLPYSPLHHLLLQAMGVPVVATSGNLSDEPICIEEREALDRLSQIADAFLVHNRPIARHVDDSVVRVMLDRELVLRRARGYAPLPIVVSTGRQPKDAPCVLAVGAQLKNTISLSSGSQVFISQHIGDLENEPAFAAFKKVIGDFEELYCLRPEIVAADAHPDYLSTKFARALASPNAPRLISVQHHVAHVLGCLAENDLEPPALGVSWDGTGYGPDGTVWGGEFFLIDGAACRRVAHLRQFRLPGGERAIKEPRRAALAVLFEMFGDSALTMNELAPVRAFSARELAALKTVMTRGLNSPMTSSAGRLFDAVAALVGLRQRVRFEGQAAMELEFAAAVTGSVVDSGPHLRALEPARRRVFPISGSQANSSPVAGSGGIAGDLPTPGESPFILDWAPIIESILEDLKRGVSTYQISHAFHEGLVGLILAVARRAGCERVLLSGGCFQNRRLTELAVQLLRAGGFRPYWHQRVPPNDGGISLGQTVAALNPNWALQVAGTPKREI